MKWHRRGLCNKCYLEPDSKQRFPSTSETTHRTARLPAAAIFAGTNGAGKAWVLAVPGSKAKILAMQQRAAMRLSLWHPGPASGMH